MTHELLEAWLQCERRAWLQSHRAELRSPEGGLERYLREQRADLRRVYEERIARALGRPRASLLRADRAVAPGEARGAGVAAVLDAAFELPAASREELGGVPVRARVDGMRRLGDGWLLEVIAAGTRARAHHVRRLALAGRLAAGEGLLIRRSAVVHVRHRRGSEAQDPLLQSRDVSAAARMEQRRLPLRLQAAAASLRSALEPRTGIGAHCHRPRTCPFLAHCWSAYGEHSLLKVPDLRRATRSALRSAGWSDVRDLPPQPAGLTPHEQEALDDARSGRVRIDPQALRRGLAQLDAPVAYLDLEFATPAAPWLPGTEPFQPVPFQFSLHIEDGQGDVKQYEHLHRDPRADPRPALAGALATGLAGAATIVVYDAAAERLLLNELAEVVPASAAPLRRAAERTWDLLALVRAAVRHPGFGAAWGLKRVAATLAPGSYEGVDLPDGLAAQAAWRQLLRSGDDGLADALKRYCGADSRAMLSIVRVLRGWVYSQGGGGI